MNRFMVWLRFGSLLLLFSLILTSQSSAQMPRGFGTLYPSSQPYSSSPPTVQWHESLESGWAESRRRGVPMLIYITSDNCHYCDAMKRDTWGDASVRGRLAKGFVAIRLNRRRNSAVLSRIDVTTYPTTLVGAPRGKIIGKRIGYQPPAALHGLLSESESRRRVPRQL